VHAFVRARETGGRRCRLSSRPFLVDLDCENRPEENTRGQDGANVIHAQASARGIMAVDNSEDGTDSVPFILAYGQAQAGSQLLAMGDEDGYITVVDTVHGFPASSTSPQSATSPSPRARWVAHHNAIFDLAWKQGNHQMLTSSGDQSIALWNTMYATQLGAFMGHGGTVRSLVICPTQEDVFASTSRDGSICIWDTRTAAVSVLGDSVPNYRPVATMRDAHARRAGKKRGRSKSQGRKDSVTSAVYLSDGNTLASAGAADSIIKLWDIRQPRRKRASIPLNAEPGPPLSLFLARSCPAPEDQTTRLHGVISMTVHAESNRLLASCTNSRHYLFDALRPDHGVIASYDGHESRSSFYIRAAFSPCGSHIASGSSDKSLRIWQVDRPQDGPYKLDGHDGEVSSVAWCPSDFCQLASCGDDATVRLWSVNSRAQQPRRTLCHEKPKAPVPSAMTRLRQNSLRNLIHTAPSPRRIETAGQTGPPAGVGPHKAPQTSAREPLTPVQENNGGPVAASTSIAVLSPSAADLSARFAGEDENSETQKMLCPQNIGPVCSAESNICGITAAAPPVAREIGDATCTPAGEPSTCRNDAHATVQLTIPRYLFTPAPADGTAENAKAEHRQRHAGRSLQRGQLTIAAFLNLNADGTAPRAHGGAKLPPGK